MTRLSKILLALTFGLISLAKINAEYNRNPNAAMIAAYLKKHGKITEKISYPGQISLAPNPEEGIPVRQHTLELKETPYFLEYTDRGKNGFDM